jgi:hypothetical protein
MRVRIIVGLATLVILFLSLIQGIQPARANVPALALFRRSCGLVSAFALYDGFSEGKTPFYVAFAVDLNGNGVYGEANEPIRYVNITSGGQQEYIGATIRFSAVPEGSTISVTAYEVDSAGVPVSKQVPPVTYQCAHRPATDRLPAESPIPAPGVAVVARIRIPSIVVYSSPTTQSAPLGGLARGERVTVLALNRRGDWAQVDFRGKLGWIMWQTQAVLYGPYAYLPRVANAEDPTPTPAATATP